jgi:hypothetical protein
MTTLPVATIAAPACTTTKQEDPLVKTAAPASTIKTTTKWVKVPKPWPVPFVRPASTTNKLLNLRKHPACHAMQAISMRTGMWAKVTMPLTTIPLKIASTAPATHTATLAPPFATDVLPANKPLKMKPPKKPIACPARVDGTKYKRVKTSATIAAVENINLKTVRRFVCPATLDCINRKRGNRTARNAQ